MFILRASKPEGGTNDRAPRTYASLDAAIDAALKAGLDLDKATIEKVNVTTVTVNEWIAVRVAGGHLRAG